MNEKWNENKADNFFHPRPPSEILQESVLRHKKRPRFERRASPDINSVPVSPLNPMAAGGLVGFRPGKPMRLVSKRPRRFRCRYQNVQKETLGERQHSRCLSNKYDLNSVPGSPLGPIAERGRSREPTGLVPKGPRVIPAPRRPSVLALLARIPYICLVRFLRGAP